MLALHTFIQQVVLQHQHPQRIVPTDVPLPLLLPLSFRLKLTHIQTRIRLQQSQRRIPLTHLLPQATHLTPGPHLSPPLPHPRICHHTDDTHLLKQVKKNGGFLL